MQRVPLTALVLAAAALPGCAVEQAEGQDPTPSAPAAVRADTLAGVARRIYQQEAGGAVGHAAVRRIARDRALLAALGSGNPAALRAAALRQLFNPGKHVVRLSLRPSKHEADYRIERLLSSIALPASRAVTKFGPVGRTSPWAGKRP